VVIFVQLVDVPVEWMEVGIEHEVKVGIKIEVVFEVVL
jgi:hypothetical protein